MIVTTPNGDFPLTSDCLSPQRQVLLSHKVNLQTSQHAINLRLTFPGWFYECGKSRCPQVGQLPEWWQVSCLSESSPDVDVGNMLIFRVVMGAPGSVTSHLGGPSALFMRRSYCPAGLQKEIQRRTTMGIKGWQRRTSKQRAQGLGSILLEGGKARTGGGLEARMVVGLLCCRHGQLFNILCEKKSRGENECRLGWGNSCLQFPTVSKSC